MQNKYRVKPKEEEKVAKNGLEKVDKNDQKVDPKEK